MLGKQGFQSRLRQVGEEPCGAERGASSKARLAGGLEGKPGSRCGQAMSREAPDGAREKGGAQVPGAFQFMGGGAGCGLYSEADWRLLSRAAGSDLGSNRMSPAAVVAGFLG